MLYSAVSSFFALSRSSQFNQMLFLIFRHEQHDAFSFFCWDLLTTNQKLCRTLAPFLWPSRNMTLVCLCWRSSTIIISDWLLALVEQLMLTRWCSMELIAKSPNTRECVYKTNSWLIVRLCLKQCCQPHYAAMTQRSWNFLIRPHISFIILITKICCSIYRKRQTCILQ